jgi:magnesium transporter
MREARIALVIAVSCGIIGSIVCAFLPQLLGSTSTSSHFASVNFAEHLRIVLAFGVGMFSAIMVATTLGLFLPFLFRRIGIDPAISSGPLVTTANDSISVTIYLTLTLLLVS